MSVIKIIPTRSFVIYDPFSKYMSLISGVKFHLNRSNMKFYIDQNPEGEADPVPIFNLDWKEHVSCLEFEAYYRGEKSTFQLSSNYECDKIIYKFLTLTLDENILFQNTDTEKVTLSFENGKISSIDIFKYIDSKMVDSLAIFSEAGKLFLLKQNPWEKIKLDSLTLKNNTILCKYKNDVIIYHLYINPFVLTFMNDCLLSGLVQ